MSKGDTRIPLCYLPGLIADRQAEAIEKAWVRRPLQPDASTLMGNFSCILHILVLYRPPGAVSELAG